MSAGSKRIDILGTVLAGVASTSVVVAISLLLLPAPLKIARLVYPSTIQIPPQEFGSNILSQFTLSNNGTGDLIVDHFFTSCSCAGVEVEREGVFRLIDTLHIPPGGQVNAIIRISVGARPGSSQRVQVFFASNDPDNPEGEINVQISRVNGGIYAEPVAAIFGDTGNKSDRVQTIRIYNNGVKSRSVKQVRASHPERFELTLLPPQPGVHEPQEHDSAGQLIAVVEVRPKSGWEGRMDGYFEVILSDEQRSPDRVDIIGEVRGKIHYYPDTLVLPRQLAGKQLLTGELVFSHRDNKAIRLEAESVPEGISLTITPSELNQCKVHVEYNPKTSDNASIAMTHTTKIVQLRLKVTSYDKEISFVTIPLILIRQ